jgi:hypothetical protein
MGGVKALKSRQEYTGIIKSIPFSSHLHTNLHNRPIQRPGIHSLTKKEREREKEKNIASCVYIYIQRKERSMDRERQKKDASWMFL